ncbi:hypothetical protein Strvi_8341 [Streptomyces violaceusniger Tu 4113]|uniref:Uncharacterized protein n=2 Tax=Streptomyces violaceusniger TaxID=68280 RepID=G2P961_STRV4|nr:hypothetical protein Strvi_8341 [Streptomyces violaceusniger Tu 4113]
MPMSGRPYGRQGAINGLIDVIVERGLVIASELATNAIRHATRYIPDPEQRGCFRLKVECPSDHLVPISTFDRSLAVQVPAVRFNPADLPVGELTVTARLGGCPASAPVAETAAPMS